MLKNLTGRRIIVGVIGLVFGLLWGIAFNSFAPHGFLGDGYLLIFAPISGTIGLTSAAWLTMELRNRGSKNLADIVVYGLEGVFGGAIPIAIFWFSVTLIDLLLETGIEGLPLGLFMGITMAIITAIPAGLFGGFLGLLLGSLGLLADRMSSGKFLLGSIGALVGAAIGSLLVMLFIANFNI